MSEQPATPELPDPSVASDVTLDPAERAHAGSAIHQPDTMFGPYSLILVLLPPR